MIKEKRNEDRDLKEAIKILSQGGIIIFPTDTAFGIGCRIDRPEAIKRLFRIKKRPFSQPVPILVSSSGMAKNYFVHPLSKKVQFLMENYWPGALTIVYYAQEKMVPSLVRGGGETLGIRFPKHQIAVSLIKKNQVAILGPSANFHGQPTPYSLSQLDKDLIRKVDYLLKGRCFQKKVSTVIDCTKHPEEIIRQGAVKLKLDYRK